MRITHLTLDEQTRQLAAMRSAMLRQSMSHYISNLIAADAEESGLAALLRDAPSSTADDLSETSRP